MRRVVALLPVCLACLAGAVPAHAWTWPVDGPVLRPFVYGEDPYAAGEHRGIDIGADAGMPVRAPAAGDITFAGTVPRGGRTITIRTPDGYAVTLLHLGAIAVERGAGVAEGATIGTAGSSGTPELAAPYVHLGIRVASEPLGYLDPLPLLPSAGTIPPPSEVADPAANESPADDRDGGASGTDGGSAPSSAKERGRRDGKVSHPAGKAAESRRKGPRRKSHMRTEARFRGQAVVVHDIAVAEHAGRAAAEPAPRARSASQSVPARPSAERTSAGNDDLRAKSVRLRQLAAVDHRWSWLITLPAAIAALVLGAVCGGVGRRRHREVPSLEAEESEAPSTRSGTHPDIWRVPVASRGPVRPGCPRGKHRRPEPLHRRPSGARYDGQRRLIARAG